MPYNKMVKIKNEVAEQVEEFRLAPTVDLLSRMTEAAELVLRAAVKSTNLKGTIKAHGKQTEAPEVDTEAEVEIMELDDTTGQSTASPPPRKATSETETGEKEQKVTLPPNEEWPPVMRPPIRGVSKRLEDWMAPSPSSKGGEMNKGKDLDIQIMERLDAILPR